MLKLAKVSRVTLVDQVVEAIKERIESGDLHPGDALPGEIELGKQLGVARTTVREAIRLLMGLGLVTRSEERLCVAPVITPAIQARLVPLVMLARETQSLYEARRVLEGELAALAALRACASDIEGLKALNDRLVGEWQNDPVYWEIDMAFHKGIARCAGNTVLYTVYETVYEMMEKLEREVRGRIWRIKRSTPARHAALIAAIENRDANRARKLVYKGLRAVEAALLEARAETSLQGDTAPGPAGRVGFPAESGSN